MANGVVQVRWDRASTIEAVRMVLLVPLGSGSKATLACQTEPQVHGGDHARRGGGPFSKVHGDVVALCAEHAVVPFEGLCVYVH